MGRLGTFANSNNRDQRQDCFYDLPSTQMFSGLSALSAKLGFTGLDTGAMFFKDTGSHTAQERK